MSMSLFRTEDNFSGGFLNGAVVKNPLANAGNERDMGLNPGSGRSPGVGNDNPFQYSCLENSIHREASGLQSMGSQKSLTQL